MNEVLRKLKAELGTALVGRELWRTVRGTALVQLPEWSLKIQSLVKQVD